jgi:excisionase family DNA binding protein
LNQKRETRQPHNQQSDEYTEAIKHIEQGFAILASVVVKSVIQGINDTGSTRLPSTSFSMPDSAGKSEKLAYSASEVAKLLGTSPASVYEGVRTKQIPSIRWGRRIFIPRVALEKMMANVE